jgi:aerobic carbon-monoxide dehydrogenase medium subunit
MRRFEYVRPKSIEEATTFLDANHEDSLVLAGGTAVIAMLSQGLLRPKYVVDVAALPGLKGLQRDNGSLRIGALTPIAILHRDPTVKGLLAEAASQVASIRVRSVATVGGSCCYGEPQTDLPPALIAMNARAHIAGTRGDRWVSLQDFFRGPYETALQPGELLTELEIPTPAPNSGGCHVKFTVGSVANKPIANVSCVVQLEGQRVKDARIVLGAVGPTPMLATRAVGVLLNVVPNDAHIAEAAAMAAEESDPIEDLRGPEWYKRRMVKVLTERAIRCALQKAEGSVP